MPASDPRGLEDVLDAVSAPVHAYLASLPDRRVWSSASPDEVRAVVDGPLPDGTTDAVAVVTQLASELEPFITAHASGRYFGFVIGGLHPAAYGAELLAASWDQNAGLFALAPGVAIADEVAARWVVELLGLPDTCGVGFVTGGQMATFTCLAAARDHVLRAVGWDVEADGLRGAPQLHVVVKTGRHSTVPRALRYLGPRGAHHDRGRQRRPGPHRGRRPGPDAAGPRRAHDRVRRGGQRQHGGVRRLRRRRRGSRGTPRSRQPDLGARRRRHRPGRGRGPRLRRADLGSGAAGLVVHRRAQAAQRRLRLRHRDHPPFRRPPCRDERARQLPRAGQRGGPRAAGLEPGVLPPRPGARHLRDPALARPQRRRELVERTTSLARRFADQLAASGRAEVANDVVFNQVLVRWLPPKGWQSDDWNDEVTARIQRDGTAFFSGTTWRGQRLMRVSVADCATDEDDVDHAVAALLRGAEVR